MAEGLEILLQVPRLEVRLDTAEPEELPELPERKSRKLMSLAQRKAALGIEVGGQLDAHLVDRHACGVEDVLRNLEICRDRHAYMVGADGFLSKL